MLKAERDHGESTAERIRAESETMNRWQRLAELEEEFLKQRSKVHWLDVRDGNNKFFHSSAKIREVRNAIHEILRVDGSITTTDEEIKEEAVNFFAEFMRLQPVEFEGASTNRLTELLGFQCSGEDCSKLVRQVTGQK